ncbi:signal transduction histidine kinase [Trichormus variabilis ATCC 29413]|uniref:Signal transduction histidine kinase n=3 Tax=Nostocaceae TaxID=1162 RepID=Q3M8S2_TRIV2|nr:PAS domain S-box protein [Trichormus variabilis]ABA22614.1 signal transduction histidine kinase [Trichormus variabilis ATCC 29413]MBC1214366.1 PAS domain S-box protein [Trichormus variabilis ARAD]MBC1254850.1 PAS domain S-box protein [Trichormus variabilis V5]MBC1265479.1 PAS domain S-box protein [Trichormus variabilis FSR]MBC1327502.1 PAS domain S-box protein [Trichormus variabilis 9RC]MBD2382616.1 PAS domain S-box protein [Trichormus variabilis FACHB-319]QFZ12879.1 PAS domain S-box prot
MQLIINYSSNKAIMLFTDSESLRLEALYQYCILDTPPEEVFDDLVNIAADSCNTPIALISILDSQREWFKSKVGISELEIPRDICLGIHTIGQNDILIIPDTWQDERFVENPLVRQKPSAFRFYGGVPLINSEGFALGCLAVIDFTPRNLSLKEQQILQRLARQIIRQLELHKKRINHESSFNAHLLFTNNPRPMWICEMQSLQILDVNQAAITQYGYSKTEFLQMQFAQVFVPEFISDLIRDIEQEYSQLPFLMECQHRLRGGQVIDVELAINYIEYSGYQACLVDTINITEHIQIERNLQKSEARVRTILEAIPVPLVISRVDDGLILYTNSEFLQTFQLSGNDLINHYAADLYENSEDRQQILEALSQHGSLQNYDIQFKKSDGTSFWAIASIQYLNFNNEYAILTVLYDITERKNIEAKLQEQNALLQSIFAGIPLMIALISPEGQVQWINQELERLLGWSLRDYQTLDIFAELYPQPEYRQSVIKFMQSGECIWGDFRTQTRYGQVLDTSWINIKLADGRIIGIGQEITERKQTERALKGQIEREQLMRAVAQRIRQSLNLQNILNATVKEIKDLLGVDRVVVYQFAPDMSGKIVAESVKPGWKIALGADIQDNCFQSGAGADYCQGHKRAIANIYTAGLTDCHLHLLEQFQVKANLVVPILLEVSEGNTVPQLWGLLIAHQCSTPRDWEAHELDLLDQLSVPIAIAIQQSSILQQAQNELAERQKVEVRLRSALAEKEVLLKEVHHRVKNNLQIVSGLLLLHSQTLKDPELIRTLQESQNRIESISMIHKNLYTSPNIGQLDVVDYVNNLATSILISYQLEPGRISLETHIHPVDLNLDQAIACGLIINELISNSLKHAFPQNTTGAIKIDLQKVDDKIEMTIQDNGIGLPDNLDWRYTDSLGLSLVHDLVTEQLEGTVSIERQPGTTFKIQFSH